MEKVRQHPNGCWLWIGGRRGGSGYGSFFVEKIDGRPVSDLAHRWAYTHFVGPIPDGLELDHICRVPACVNPAHLEAVTHSENMRRSPTAGRMDIGDKRRAQTHCKNGHEFNEENTRVYRDSRGRPHRQCRACRRVGP